MDPKYSPNQFSPAELNMNVNAIPQNSVTRYIQMKHEIIVLRQTEN